MHVVGSKIADYKSYTALWKLKMLHASIKDTRSERIVFMEFFCTKHQLGEVVITITDVKKKIAVQKCNLIDAVNRCCVKKYMAMVDKLERG